MDFSTDIPDAVRDLSPSDIAWQSYHAQRTNTPIDTVLDRHIANPQTLLTFTVTEQEAREYCQSIGMKFFAKKWQDKAVIISIWGQRFPHMLIFLQISIELANSVWYS